MPATIRAILQGASGSRDTAPLSPSRSRRNAKLDRQLTRALHHAYDPVLGEPLPDELARLAKAIARRLSGGSRAGRSPFL
jgi:hypothetical protein